MTVKDLTKQLNAEKYDIKNTKVLVCVDGERFEIEAVGVYDGAVHLTTGDTCEEL